jgi:acyl-CoA-binding protein
MAPVPGKPMVALDNYVAKHAYAQATDDAMEKVLEQLREPRDLWQHVAEKDGVKISKKIVPGAPVPMVRGDATFDAPAEGVARILSTDDTKTQMALDSGMNKCILPEQLDSQSRIAVTEFDGVFPVANRYFSVVYSVRRVPEGILCFCVDADYPEAAAMVSKGAVRGTLHFQGYLLRPVDGGKCDVSYMAFMNLNGSIPKFVINLVVNDNPMVVRNLAKVASGCSFDEEEHVSTEPAPEPPAQESPQVSVAANAEQVNAECADDEKPIAVHPLRSQTESLSTLSTTSPLRRSFLKSGTWKEWSGREDGKHGYKLGDIRRGWKRSREEKRLAKAGRAATLSSLGEAETATPVIVDAAESQPACAETQAEQPEQPELSLDELFVLAQESMKALPQMSNSDKLQVYAHYKQANVGKVQGSRPGAMNVANRYKWDAWAALGSMKADDAKRGYCELADRLAPGWRPNSRGAKAVTKPDMSRPAPALDIVSEEPTELVAAAPTQLVVMDPSMERGAIAVTLVTALLLRRFSSWHGRTRFLALLLLMSADRFQTASRVAQHLRRLAGQLV